MKSKLLFAAFALAGAASAQSITVDGGRWTTSSETGGFAVADGVREELPSEYDTSTECWSSVHDRTISEETMELDNCVFYSKVRRGQRLEYEMTCVFDGIEMDGDMVVIAAPDAESVLASIVFEAEVPGVEVIAWTDMWLRRVGSC